MPSLEIIKFLAVGNRKDGNDMWAMFSEIIKKIKWDEAFGNYLILLGAPALTHHQDFVKWGTPLLRMLGVG